ncbi:MAG: four-carbon acid sugar kinase family protein [Acidimicrobiales bacterium]
MIELLVAADDRTGALETAGACADAGLAAVVAVVSSSVYETLRCLVVDLGSRHLQPARAAELAAAIERRTAGYFAHKIDSTLRGNWAYELVARQRAGNRRILVIPAFPAVGRTCVGGLVFEQELRVSHGVAGRDARAPVKSSRPAAHLHTAGAAATAELADSEDVRAWLGGEGPAFAVGDAATDADLERLATLWHAYPDVLLAGTAATIGAAATTIAGVGVVPTLARPSLDGPVLVVCGSLHPAARAQIDAFVTAGALAVSTEEDPGTAVAALRAGRHVVLASGRPHTDAVASSDAVVTSERLAAVVAQLAAATRVPTMILIGGDTAAAVLGDGPVEVGGTVAPGVAWCRPSGDAGPLVLTKPGGFGGPNALIDLLAAKMSP